MLCTSSKPECHAISGTTAFCNSQLEKIVNFETFVVKDSVMDTYISTGKASFKYALV